MVGVGEGDGREKGGRGPFWNGIGIWLKEGGKLV